MNTSTIFILTDYIGTGLLEEHLRRIAFVGISNFKRKKKNEKQTNTKTTTHTTTEEQKNEGRR